MPLIKLALDEGFQPQYVPEIDRTHPVGKDVLAYFNAGESLRFGNNFPTTIGGTPTVGAAGKCIDYASTKTQYPYDATIANGMVTARGCAALVVLDVDALTGYGGVFSSEDAANQRVALELRLGETATDSSICTVRATASAGAYARFNSGANRIVAGSKGVRLLVSFADNDLLTVPTLYINGVSYSCALNVNTGSGSVVAPASVGLSLGGRSADTATPLDGRIYDIWLVGRGITTAEGIALTQSVNSPYALFLPQSIDIWVPSAGGATSATIAGTDGADSAAVVAATWTTAQIAGTDGADVAGITATVTTGASITGTDGADNAVIAAANWTTAQIAANDGADVSGITASANNQTSASIGATDGGDAAFLYAANWTTALLAAVDGADAAALVAGTAGATSAGISATEGADIVAIGVAGATGPLILAGSMRHAASLSSSARLATTLRGSIAHV